MKNNHHRSGPFPQIAHLGAASEVINYSHYHFYDTFDVWILAWLDPLPHQMYYITWQSSIHPLYPYCLSSTLRMLFVLQHLDEAS
jgi:hypothetical protein